MLNTYTCYDKHLLLNSRNEINTYTCYDKYLLLNSRNVYLL